MLYVANYELLWLEIIYAYIWAEVGVPSTSIDMIYERHSRIQANMYNVGHIAD